MALTQQQFNYGGQAVIEGVMMRGSRHLAVAVREPEGQISNAIARRLKELHSRLESVGEPKDVTPISVLTSYDPFVSTVTGGGKVWAVLFHGHDAQGAFDLDAWEQVAMELGAQGIAVLTPNPDGGAPVSSVARIDETTAREIATAAAAPADALILLVAEIPRIVLHEEPINSSLYNGTLSRIPFVRGLGLLWDSLGLGIRALNFSADVAVGDEANFSGPLAWGTIFVSLGLSIGLFFLLPAAAADGLHALSRIDAPLAGNLIEGIIRLLLVLGYLWLIGRIPDVQRLFGYHGAEHKAINAYEDGAPLTPESVARYPLEHPRCGTGFLLVVVFISILVFSVLGRPPLIIRLLSRVVLIPVVAGIAYEYIKLLARNMKSPIVRVLVKPQLALQRLTTREPSRDMLEVSIKALKRVLESENLPVPTLQTEAEATPV